MAECSELARATEIQVAGGCLSPEHLLESIKGEASGFRLDTLFPSSGEGGDNSTGGFRPEVVLLLADALDLPSTGATIPTIKHIDPVLAAR